MPPDPEAGFMLRLAEQPLPFRLVLSYLSALEAVRLESTCSQLKEAMGLLSSDPVQVGAGGDPHQGA